MMAGLFDCSWHLQRGEDMKILVSVITVPVLATAMFQMLLWIDREIRVFRKDRKWILLCAAAAGAAIRLLDPAGPYGFEVLASYLTVVSFEDVRTRNVHDFLHFAAGIPGVCLLASNWTGWPSVSWLFLFWALQAVLFRRMYGAADCCVFSVCAMYLAALGLGFREALLHMLATFILLAVVQALRKNINRQGNLKKPVALTPYIAAAIWIFI